MSIIARRHVETREVLSEIRTIVFASYDAYMAHRGDGEFLQPIPLTEDVSARLTENYRSLRKGASHQHIRDEILSSARLDICPYCSVTNVDGVDHVLPVALYPEFSVLAHNLVPSCERCNRSKGLTCFAKDGTNLLHPYFEAFPADEMLRAHVLVAKGSVTWHFTLSRFAGMNARAFVAIRNMFEVLELEDLYRQVSVVDVMDRVQSMAGQYEAGGSGQVREYLRREAESARMRGGNNYWKTAILLALAENDEFCNGGFRYLLPEQRDPASGPCPTERMG